MDRKDTEEPAETQRDEVTEFAFAPPPRQDPGPKQPEEHKFKDWALI